ncbi:hypothetical protein [Phyllobacterium endophyticum]|uniref:Uncharacterized protein n=1 Tax=Phyllobacterium endophyticum TaxID=1149773 RepID=A0A2P7AMM5_9HYPH|nr:hypothetical protein [Phyllobacterium endophyticum]MBB3238317.1 chemotaxis protein histidine kinase CheA [Phyllobacterium endophyticum]PSH55453.1 hypothetical protein CU100_22660 [Phyllobacterium endophyticum]TYR40183.1 hypothetical protein FY050_18905 [Phyllobacterium endophyticum]
MRKLLIAAAAWAILSGTAHAVPDDKTRDTIKALKFTKANAYAKAIDSYCFADHPFATQPLADAAQQEAEFRQEIGEQEKATDIIADADRMAAEHLKVDQSACAPAASFVEGVVATIDDAKQPMEAIKQSLAEAKAAQEKAALAEKRNTTCRELQSRADAANLENLVPLRMPLLDCADVLGVDNIAKVDKRIEGMRAEQKAADEAKAKQQTAATGEVARKTEAAAAETKKPTPPPSSNKAADVAAIMAKPATKPAAKPAQAGMEFVGKWDQVDGNCRGRLWDLNTKSYDGTPVTNIERNGNNFRVELSDGYSFALRNVTNRTLTWYSLESGDSFSLKRCR